MENASNKFADVRSELKKKLLSFFFLKKELEYSLCNEIESQTTTYNMVLSDAIVCRCCRCYCCNKVRWHVACILH